MQWDRVVRSMQHRLSFDFSQLSGSAIGSEGEAESREDTHAAVEALLAGTSLRAVVWLQVANLQRQAQDVALQQLAALLRHTLVRLQLHCWPTQHAWQQQPSHLPKAQASGSAAAAHCMRWPWMWPGEGEEALGGG